jgi:hypothetical protein
MGRLRIGNCRKTPETGRFEVVKYHPPFCAGVAKALKSLTGSGICAPQPVSLNRIEIVVNIKVDNLPHRSNGSTLSRFTANTTGGGARKLLSAT